MHSHEMRGTDCMGRREFIMSVGVNLLGWNLAVAHGPSKKDRGAQVCPSARHTRPRIGLQGQWDFQLDPDRVGYGEKWYAPDHQLENTIIVPGC
jgi:hypothetical protein